MLQCEFYKYLLVDSTGCLFYVTFIHSVPSFLSQYRSTCERRLYFSMIVFLKRGVGRARQSSLFDIFSKTILSVLYDLRISISYFVFLEF